MPSAAQTPAYTADRTRKRHNLQPLAARGPAEPGEDRHQEENAAGAYQQDAAGQGIPATRRRLTHPSGARRPERYAARRPAGGPPNTGRPGSTARGRANGRQAHTDSDPTDRGRDRHLDGNQANAYQWDAAGQWVPATHRRLPDPSGARRRERHAARQPAGGPPNTARPGSTADGRANGPQAHTANNLKEHVWGRHQEGNGANAYQ